MYLFLWISSSSMCLNVVATGYSWCRGLDIWSFMLMLYFLYSAHLRLLMTNAVSVALSRLCHEMTGPP
ncbi:hypothetical protein B0J11DRAFT_521258 [Dendryphion nanum]|uniref:Uncharacterized protein n=1 Tax=Dendryphion nanum TaxID=256645 RepID=A0A9P9IT10_9PLEO|nr:hypothetical protein B0J11DRAFT_521258 [Dendryphion nanum]